MRLSLLKSLIWVWISVRAVEPSPSETGVTCLMLRKFSLRFCISSAVRAW